MCLSLCISGIIDSQHGVLAQSLHRNVKACLVLQEEGAKEGDDYIAWRLVAQHLKQLC